MNSLYIKLKEFFLNNGYQLIFEKRDGDGDFAKWDLSAKHENFEFSQMLEGYYLEPSLFLVSNDLLVSYDIFEGSYNSEIFVKTNENQELLILWKKLLEEEINRLNLSIYIDNNSFD